MVERLYQPPHFVVSSVRKTDAKLAVLHFDGQLGRLTQP